jgi:hypothetical protein
MARQYLTICHLQIHTEPFIDNIYNKDTSDVFCNQ